MRSAICLLIVSLCVLQCSSSTGGEEDTPTYSFSASVSPSAGGSVNPESGDYEEGTEVEVQASPSEGWQFVEWTGDQSSTENPLTFSITSDTEITANFEEVGPNAQSFTETVTITDGENSIELGLGMDTEATSGFNDGLDEEVPPPPPSGSFYGQFNITDYTLKTDIRPVTEERIHWEMEFAPKEGRSLTLNWDFSNTSHIGSLTLVDDLENPSVEVDMKSNSSHSVSESTEVLYIISEQN